MTRLDKYRLVIIDDIGYVKKSDAEIQVLFEFESASPQHPKQIDFCHEHIASLMSQNRT